MPMADSGGPGWIRKNYVASEKRRRGLGPVRDFLATLFGRSRRSPRASAGGDDVEGGGPGAVVGAPLVPPAPTLSGVNARRIEDGTTL